MRYFIFLSFVLTIFFINKNTNFFDSLQSKTKIEKNLNKIGLEYINYVGLSDTIGCKYGYTGHLVNVLNQKLEHQVVCYCNSALDAYVIEF